MSIIEGNRRSTRNLAEKPSNLKTPRGPLNLDPDQLSTATSHISLSHPPIAVLPSSENLSTKLTGLAKKDLALLKQKQHLLRSSNPDILSDLKSEFLKSAFEATLVFAQREAGTAFCISPTGLLLTCSHCVAENEEDLKENMIKWLMFASGRVVRAKCIAYDAQRDLALLQIVGAESLSPSSAIIPKLQETSWTSFPTLPLSEHKPSKGATMMCVGHPGSEDLETTRPGVKTGYDVLHVSYGRFVGIATGADVQDNSEIGALMHNCWTYWGHSGAPLCLRKDGSLVGMHSSWDDQTGMRRGVAWEAIVSFLEEHGNPHQGGSQEGRLAGSSSELPIVLD